MIKVLGAHSNGRNSHAFRHTVTMNMLRHGKIDPAIVAAIAGNTPKTIYAHYNGQVSVDEQREGERTSDRVRGRKRI
jgi:integrase